MISYVYPLMERYHSTESHKYHGRFSVKFYWADNCRALSCKPLSLGPLAGPVLQSKVLIYGHVIVGAGFLQVPKTGDK